MNYKLLLILAGGIMLGGCGQGDDSQAMQDVGETMKDAGQAAQDAVQSATEEAGDMVDNMANADDGESGDWNPEATDVKEEKAPNGKIVDSGLGYEYVVVEHPDKI